MYRVQPNVLGMTTQGYQQITVTAPQNVPAPPAGMIRGLNVGINTLPVASTRPGIQRLSAAPGIGWQDGHLGNNERLYFTATDVMPTGPYAVGRTHTIWQQGGIARPPVVYSTGPTFNTNWCVSKVLPTGFVLGKEMCIITQGGGGPPPPAVPPLALASLSVVWYPMLAATWGLGTDVTPTAPPNPALQTDTALAFGGAGSAISGTGVGSEQIIVSIQFDCPAMTAIVYPQGIIGGWISILRG